MSDDAEKRKSRQEVIDDAIAAGDGSNQERDTPPGIKGVQAADNPNKPGSMLHKLWERKRQAGELIAQK